MGTEKRNGTLERVDRGRKIDKSTRVKLVALFFVVILAFLVFIGKIIYLSLMKNEEYERQVRRQTQNSRTSSELAYRRGDITDRNGTILATSEKIYYVILDCNVVNTEKKKDGEMVKPYVEPTVRALTSWFGVEEQVVREYLEGETTKNSQYINLTTRGKTKALTLEEKNAFEEYLAEFTKKTDDELTEEEQAEKEERRNIKGIWFEDTYKRVYPFGTIACDVIGFSNSRNVASIGIEGYYSSNLNGTNGKIYSYYGANDTIRQEIAEPVDGSRVVSTIDINIQKIIRSKIEEFNTRMSGLPENENANLQKGAKNVGVLLMDPNNGEVLGMDATDWYDLNEPRDLSQYYTQEEIDDMEAYEEEIRVRRENGEEVQDYDKETGRRTKAYALNEIWSNFCISNTYEPGSTAKPMNVAAALEAGAVTTDDTFVCDGYQQIGKYKIRCSIYPGAHGTETVQDALKNSCNDALMQIAEKMGSETFLKYQNLFGFGLKTGIDLPREASGIIYREDQWNSTALATSSFGQGYNVTMIQQMAAFCSVINGGYYYQPRVVSRLTDSNGSLVSTIEPKLLKQVISSDTSDIIRSALGTAVEEGTGRSAKVDGYTMGGKTGTAEKSPRKQGNYVVSFIGFAPLENPQVAIYVVIDEPHAEKQANSGFAQEVARSILADVLPYMNIYPNDGSAAAGEGTETNTGNDLPNALNNTENLQDNNRYSEGIPNSEQGRIGE